MASNTKTPREEATATERLRESSSRVREDIGELGGALKGVAGEAFDSARGTAAEYGERMKRTVQKRPIASTLIALGAGAALGMLLRRR